MKTVFKLVIAVALLNAVVRGADAAWNYYQLKDAAQRALLFGASATSGQLHTQIMSEAGTLKIPLRPENLAVQNQGGRRVASAVYTQPIEFFPNYLYPFEFSFTVESINTGATPPDDPPRR